MSWVAVGIATTAGSAPTLSSYRRAGLGVGSQRRFHAGEQDNQQCNYTEDAADQLEGLVEAVHKISPLRIGWKLVLGALPVGVTFVTAASHGLVAA